MQKTKKDLKKTIDKKEKICYNIFRKLIERRYANGEASGL